MPDAIRAPPHGFSSWQVGTWDFDEAQEGEQLQTDPDLPGGYDQVDVCLEDTWVLEPGVEGLGEEVPETLVNTRNCIY